MKSRLLLWCPRTFPALALLTLVSVGGCDSVEGPGVGPETCLYSTFFSDPAWHPDSRYLAAEHADSLDTDGDGRLDAFFTGIWLVDAETGATQPLLAGFSDPAWSPDGQRLAVHSGAQIYTVEVENLNPARVDTASLRQLTTEGRNFFPAWSPDGEWIAYDSNVDDPDGGYAIWTTQADGSEKQRVVPGRFADWAPGGDALIYEGLYSDIYRVLLADTSSIVRLTFDDNPDMQPRYSPDGTQVAFTTEVLREGQRPARYLHLVNPDGSGLYRLSPDDAWSFDWSPDSQRLVFLRLVVTEPARWSGQLWLINADGTGLRQLTDYYPAWGRTPWCDL